MINIDHAYVCKPDNFEFVDGIFELCRTAEYLGYMIFVVTNQAGIGRGYYTEQDLLNLTDWMLAEFIKQGVDIDKVYFCPAHSEHGIGKYKVDSPNRKPNPGMILQANEEFKINLAESVVVGDKESDIQAGVAAGVGCNVLFCPSEKERPVRSSANTIVTRLSDVSSILYREQIANIKQLVAERDRQIFGLSQTVADLEMHLSQTVAELETHVSNLNAMIEEIWGSTSWRITAALRFVASAIRKVRSIIIALPNILQKGNGFWPTLLKSVRILKNEGISGIKKRIRRFFANQAVSAQIGEGSQLGETSQLKFSIVPYYVDHRLDSTVVAKCGSDVTIAIHLHLFYIEMIEEFASYLNNIPVQFDLYVSVPRYSDAIAI